MKNYIKACAVASAVALATSIQAQVTINNSSFGTATTFPTYSISGLNGPLSFQDVLASPAGATLQGGVVQGAIAANTAIGEIFNWTGSANGNVLSAISIVDAGGGGGDTYQPFLFDLGTGLFNTTSATFNPSAQVDLFANSTVTLPALGSANFLEFDFSGADLVTLTVGHSYAFGLLNTSGTPSFNFRRSNGAQSDPNGVPFQITSGGLSGTTANVPGYGGGPRNIFIGIYTEPVPEPATMALLGLGILAGGVMIRRRKV
jgi:hypothetical protein